MNRKVKQNLAWELVTVLKTDFLSQMKTSGEYTFVYIAFFTLLIMYCHAKQC